ncbi:MAG: iron-sulfur cluster assembly scaffold protein [Candidatus Micrarchaeia archaeon]
MALDIYAESLLENYEKPQNRGKMEHPTVSVHEENTSCGDEMTVYLKIVDGKLTDVKFDGSGCAISIGSASIVSSSIKGMSISEIEKIGKERVISMIGIDPGPGRMHCATLFMRAVREAISKYENKPADVSTKEL